MDVAARKAEQGMAGVRPSAFSSGKHSGSKRDGQLCAEEDVCVRGFSAATRNHKR